MNVSALFQGQTLRPALILLRPYAARVTRIAAMAFVGAAIESGFFLLVSGLALAITGRRAQVGPFLGYYLPTTGAVGIAGLALALRLAISVLNARDSARLTSDVLAAARREMTDAYLGTSWAVQHEESGGRLQQLLNFAEGSTNAVRTACDSLVALMSLLALLAASLAISAPATLAVLTSVLFIGFALTPLRNRIRGAARGAARAAIQLGESVEEATTLAQEIQAFGVQRAFGERIRLTSDRHAGWRYQQLLSSRLLQPLYVSLAYAAILAALAALTVAPVVSLSEVSTVMLIMVRSLTYGQNLQNAAGDFEAAIPYIERTQEAVRHYTDRRPAGGTMLPDQVAPLEFHNVSFRYQEGRKRALHQVSFRVDPGWMVGVIGPSGAGKSTIAQLALGLRTPEAGAVTTAGVDLRQVSREGWARRVAFVPQEPALLTGTVTENVRFLREGIADEEVRRASDRAQVLAEILELPEGFDSHIGNAGSSLSGGQRQRVAIARALAGGAQLLVMDEPTSALDAESESLMRETLAELHGKVTVLVIAHRLTTLEHCDRILVIQAGKVTGFDTPETLQKQSAFYQRLIQLGQLH